jgi:hypothetical protein
MQVLKAMAEHLGRTIWIYFFSFALSYVFFSWSLISALASQVSQGNLGKYNVLLLSASLLLFVVMVAWPFLFVGIFRELYGVIFPQELRLATQVGMRALRPGLAIEALKTLSRLDPFRRVFPQAALIVPFLSLGELLLLFYFPSVAILVFPLFLAFPLSIFVLYMPSGLSRFVTPSQRLLSILSIVHFLRSRQEDLRAQHAKNPFLFDLKQIIRREERFVIRKASSYFNEFLAEVAPAARANLAKYWATLYAAMSLKADDDDEFQRASNTVEAMRQILEGRGDERTKVNQLMEILTSTKDSLRDSWQMVEERNITVETEAHPSPQELQTTLLSVLSVAATFIGLLRVLFFK